MRRRTGRLTAFGLILALLLACFGAAAAEGIHTEVANDMLDVEVRLGYEERITYGKMIPVRVTVRNSGSDLEGVLAVNTYASVQQYDRYETEIYVPAGGERTIVLPVEAHVRQEVFTAEILQDGQVICAVNASPEGIINPSAMMIGVLSTRPRNLAALDINQENDTLNRFEFWSTVALTPETLPDDPELLGAFGMIVLDDADPALLTEKQQKALRNWVREGHILLCGGGTAAPRNLAFLGDMTELRAEDFTVSDSVHEALESFLGRKSTGRHPEIALAKITGGDPIATDTKGNGLVWKVGAGAGRVYVLAWEAGDPTLNAENLMHVFYQQMLIDNDASLYNDILYSRENNSALYTPGDDSPIRVRNTLPIAAAVIGAAALIGLVLWIILNRRGVSKWMWAGIPLLALAAAAVITLMTGSSALNRPVASVSVNMVQGSEGTMKYYTAVSAASPKAGIHRYSMDGEKLEVNTWNESYWYDEEDEENKPKTPGTLRVIRFTGERSEAAENVQSPWESTELFTVRASDERANVRAEIWKESDGLHGTVVNDSDFSLKEGAVICMWGYVRIPALAPGESADFAMIAETAADPYSAVFKNGRMVQNANTGIYNVVNQMFFGYGEDYRYNSRDGILSGMITGATDMLTVADNPKMSGSHGKVVFVYSAQPEETKVSAIYADGKEITSKSVLPMLTVEAAYREVGKTGIVFRAPGMDEAVRCVLDGNGMPAGDMDQSASGPYYSSYFPLTEKPTFRFTPSGLENTEITSLIIGMEQWYINETKLYVLNAKERKWVEVGMNEPLKDPGQYLDRNGNLYCQFRSASGESYTEIPAPTLTLEGRVKNAQAQ